MSELSAERDAGTPAYDPWLMQDYERDAETWDGDTRVTPPGSGRAS
jgi:hypothetical protein